RKTLASQLDRLDGILDALDVALAEAVRDAVAGAVREAVVAVSRELMTNPEILAAVAAAAAPAAPLARPAGSPPEQPPPGRAPSVRGRVRRAWNAAVAVLTFVAAWALSAAPSAINWARQACQFVWKHRAVAGASLAVGLAVGVPSYLSGPTVSSAALAVCGTA